MPLTSLPFPPLSGESVPSATARATRLLSLSYSPFFPRHYLAEKMHLGIFCLALGQELVRAVTAPLNNSFIFSYLSYLAARAQSNPGHPLPPGSARRASVSMEKNCNSKYKLYVS